MAIPIKSILTLKVDVRLLSVLLMIMGILWWYLLILVIGTKASIGGLHLFWSVFFIGLLFGGPFIAIGLLLVHAQETRKHHYWVYAAVYSAVSPWLAVAMLLAFAIIWQ